MKGLVIMANCCFTYQAFCSKNKETLEEAYSKINKNCMNIADVLGVTDQEYQRSAVLDVSEIRELERNGDKTGIYYFEIQTDDAWNPHFEASLRFIEDYEDIWFEYMADETGMCLYCKQSDNVYSDEYFIIDENDEFSEKYRYEEVDAYDFAPNFISKHTRIEELTSDIEQFMFERGEYEYEDDGVKASETPEILAENREITFKGIEETITNGDCSTIIDYLESELTAMNKEDELCETAKDLLDRIKPYHTKEEKEPVKKKGQIGRD